MSDPATEVRRRAAGLCEYCRIPEAAFRRPFHIEHVIARQHGGVTELDNLALACWTCNLKKGPNLTGIDPQSKRITPPVRSAKRRVGGPFCFQRGNFRRGWYRDPRTYRGRANDGDRARDEHRDAANGQVRAMAGRRKVLRPVQRPPHTGNTFMTSPPRWLITPRACRAVRVYSAADRLPISVRISLMQSPSSLLYETANAIISGLEPPRRGLRLPRIEDWHPRLVEIAPVARDNRKAVMQGGRR